MTFLAQWANGGVIQEKPCQGYFYLLGGLGKNSKIETLQEQLMTTHAKVDSLLGQVRDLELAMTQSQTKLEAQREIVAELRTFFNARKEQDGPNSSVV